MISAAVQFTHKQHPWLFALPFFGTMGSGWKWFRAVTVRTARRDRHHTHRTRQGYHRRARLAWIRSSLGIPSVWLRVMMCGCFPSQITLSRTIPEGTRGPDFFTSLRLTGMVDLSRRDSNPSKRLQSVLHPKQLSGVRSLQLSHLRERLDRIIVELSAHKSALAGSIPHCIFCGATLVLNANFCHHCGGSSPSRSRGNNTGFCEAEASPRYDAVRVQYGGWSGRKTNFSSGGERVPQSDQRSIKVGFFTLRNAPSTLEGCFCCVLYRP